MPRIYRAARESSPPAVVFNQAPDIVIRRPLMRLRTFTRRTIASACALRRWPASCSLWPRRPAQCPARTWDPRTTRPVPSPPPTIVRETVIRPARHRRDGLRADRRRKPRRDARRGLSRRPHRRARDARWRPSPHGARRPGRRPVPSIPPPGGPGAAPDVRNAYRTSRPRRSARSPSPRDPGRRGRGPRSGGS